MNFAEVRFWELLLLALGVILTLRLVLTRRGAATLENYDKVALFGLGLFLLGCVSLITLLIFLVVAIGTYVGLDWVLRHDERRRGRYLFLLIPLQLLPLFAYKYANFIVNQVFDGRIEVLRDLVIPVGISFYTFQKVAFVLDTLHFHKPLPRFLDYLNFAGFFPQIVAGPIERRESLLPQMEAFRFRWTPAGINEGAGWIVLGLFFKCCMADNFALYFDRASQTNAWLIWLTNLVFGLRIYYDFAGYSLVALGLARCLGVRLTLNFASPYCSTSAAEFWHRWHITLSQWFRDYLYIPLGGSRVKWWAANIMIVFVVSGIWHGAGWNFVLWGAMHGAFLIVNRVLGGKLRLPAPVSWALTVVASFAAWLSFYEMDPSALMAKYKAILSPAAYGASAFHEMTHRWSGPDALVLVSMLLLSSLVFALEWRSLANKGEPYSLLLKPKLLFVLLGLTILLSPGKNNDFIYFAF